MGVCEGCTDRQFARIEASMTLEFEPKKTMKTINQIFNERSFLRNNPYFRRLAQEELDRMVQGKFMRFDHDGRYIFSRDQEGRYSWQPATRTDLIRHYLTNPSSLFSPSL